ANHIQRGCSLGSFFFLEYKGTVCTAQQTRGAGDHIKFIPRRGFPGMMDNQQADAMVVRELFKASDDLVILRVAVAISCRLSDLLQGVNDDQPGIWMLLDEILQLFIQAVSQLLGIGGEMKPVGPFYPKHSEHSFL